MNQLPKEILTVKQWSYSHSLSQLKRPKHSHYTPNGSLSYRDAKERAGKHKLVGFYVTEEDPYILGDIDHLEHPNNEDYIKVHLPESLSSLLLNRRIYSEVSPSGEGIRFIAKLKDVETKQKLVGRYFKNHVEMGEYAPGKKREAQVHIGRPWNTITGNATLFSTPEINVLSLADLEAVFKLKYKGEEEVVGTDHLPPPDTDGSLPPMFEVLAALNSLPWDVNPRIKRAFKKVFNEEYTGYEYWLKVMMGMSDYASKTGLPNDALGCSEAVVRWSEKDPVGFTGVEDVMIKWKSLMKTEDKVTYHTLMALAHYNTLHWPQTKPLSKAQKEAGVTEPLPLVQQYANFEALMNFYDLKIYRDANDPNIMYLSGDQDVIDKWFVHIDIKKYHGIYYGPWTEINLLPKLSKICQDHGFINITMANVRQSLAIWKGEVNKSLDMVRLYFDTPFEKLPDDYQENKHNLHISTYEHLFECLTIKYLTSDEEAERALYLRYYKSWLMGIARNIFFPDSIHMNNCVMLLVGAEQIRKTSHFKYILPKFMREDRVAFTTHGFANETSVRDVTKLAAQNNLVVWDEIEQYLTTETESNFKKLIDNNPVKVIDKYEVIPTYIRPVAVYGGTSNQREFKLSDNGSRRLFIIPVSWVDTDTMDKVNWWRVINDMRDEIESAKGEAPWLLTEAELELQTRLHAKVKSKSSLDLVLADLFKFDQKLNLQMRLPAGFDFRKADYLWTAAAISNRLNQSGMHNVARKHLVHVLERMCGDYTGTSRTPHHFKGSKVYVERGQANYGGRKKFWMPPLITNSLDQGSNYFDESDATQK